MTKTMRKNTLSVVLLSILFFVSFLCFFAACWFVNVYGRIGFDAILFTLQSSLSGVQADLVLSFLGGALLPTLVFTGLAVAVLNKRPGRRPFRVYAVSLTALSLLLVVLAAVNVELPGYVKDMVMKTDLYEQQYVDPAEAELDFPEEKRNLVYIMLESMEVSYLSEELGGGQEHNLIPELYTLAKENINFSNNASVGGFHQTSGASWTIGAMVAQTAGIPLKTPSGNQNDYGSEGEEFLPGVTSITDILAEEGYHTTLMVGSDANFGERKPYFLQHGADEVYDIYTARADKIVPRDYFVWWGMEDLHLFDYAKQELTEIAAQEEPFAFTMLTVDTHHIDGYQCEYCTGEYEEPYEQSISCSSRQVAEFVDWLEEQPFYEDTTIVVTGDHESMDNGYFERNVDEDYDRMVYNCIINSAVESDNTKNRVYCAVDLFPTTLAAMGVEIENDRLGLGTNLFSDRPTLAEQMGFERFDAQLARASEYYEENFFEQEEVETTP